MKHNFDRKHNMQEHLSLFLGTPVMLQKKEDDIGHKVWLSEPTVDEGCCYKIKLSSGRIITRIPFIYDIHMYLIRHFWMMQTKGWT